MGSAGALLPGYMMQDIKFKASQVGLCGCLGVQGCPGCLWFRQSELSSRAGDQCCLEAGKRLVAAAQAPRYACRHVPTAPSLLPFLCPLQRLNFMQIMMEALANNKRKA
jgi:hypothetical protein